jgi:hypothetical protein
MAMLDKFESPQSPIEKLLEVRKSDRIVSMPVDDLRDTLVAAEYHINLLEQIIKNFREPQSRGGKTRGINKETGKNTFAERRNYAAVWMLDQFSKNKQRTFSFLEIRFTNSLPLPFNKNNLHDVWENWTYFFNDEEKSKLLANRIYVREILIQ